MPPVVLQISKRGVTACTCCRASLDLPRDLDFTPPDLVNRGRNRKPSVVRKSVGFQVLSRHQHTVTYIFVHACKVLERSRIWEKTTLCRHPLGSPAPVSFYRSPSKSRPASSASRQTKTAALRQLNNCKGPKPEPVQNTRTPYNQ
jgi:hypothetical protein